jgi:hypothetical protein
MVSNHLRSPGFRSSPTEVSWAGAFAFGSHTTVIEFHLSRRSTPVLLHLSLHIAI